MDKIKSDPLNFGSLQKINKRSQVKYKNEELMVWNENISRKLLGSDPNVVNLAST